MAKPKTTGPSLRDEVLDALRKRFKDEEDVEIRTAADRDEARRCQPTGIDALDLVLSRGRGMPCGKMVEVAGVESSGKTALCEYLSGVYTRAGSPVHYLDFEDSLDAGHLAGYGVRYEDLLTPQFRTLEQGVDYLVTLAETLSARAERLADEKLPDDPATVAFFDSIAAATPKAELDADSVEDSQMAQTARAMSKACKLLLHPLARSDATVVFVNQVRDVMNARGAMKKTQTPGGRAIRHAYAIRLWLAAIEQIKGKDGRVLGHIAQVTAEKNKCGPRRMSCEVMLSYSRGIDADWTNFEWYKGEGFISAAGTKGWRWDGREDTFVRRDFGAWRAANGALVEEARQAIYARTLSAMDTSGLPGKQAEKADDPDEDSDDEGDD